MLEIGMRSTCKAIQMNHDIHVDCARPEVWVPKRHNNCLIHGLSKVNTHLIVVPEDLEFDWLPDGRPYFWCNKQKVMIPYCGANEAIV